MTFKEISTEIMRRFKNIKAIYRNETPKGICTTVILKQKTSTTNKHAVGVVRLMDGDKDDIENAVLWAYAKAINSITINGIGYNVGINTMSLWDAINNAQSVSGISGYAYAYATTTIS